MRLVLGSIGLLLAACDDGFPVKYEICDAHEQNCFVSAKFKKFENCEEHREWGKMLCQKSPGRLVCEAPSVPSMIATSRCTR